MKNFIDVVATEDEQLDKLKNWWKENSTSIIVGVVIAIIVSVSWKWYQTNQITQQLEARAIYLELVDKKDIKTFTKLKEQHSDSTYLPYAKLFMAQENFAKKQYTKTLSLLNEVKNEEADFFKHIASLRIATVYLTQNKYTKALAELNSVEEQQTFTGEYDTLKGDIYFFKKDITKAKEFYQKAIKNTQNESALAILNLKLGDIQ
jgi:predicted negative regulator of RcsB-dependent stress response